jgi:urease accessory protein UreE
VVSDAADRLRAAIEALARGENVTLDLADVRALLAEHDRLLAENADLHAVVAYHNGETLDRVNW